MIWREVARSRVRLVLNAFRSRGGRGHPLLGVVLAAVLAVLVSRALSVVFAGTASSGASASQAGTLLGFLLGGLLVGLLVFDLHEAVSTLIVDSDLELLRRAPVRARQLFLLKLVDALPRTSALIVVLGLPAVLAFHRFFPLPWWAWGLLAIQFLALWAIPIGLGVTGAIRLLCVVPAKHARDALGLVSAIVFVLLWLANSFVMPRLANTDSASLTWVDALLSHPPLALRLSPGHWAGRSMGAAAEGALGPALTGTVLLLVVAALVLWLAGWTAARHLERAQSRVGSGVAPGRPRPLTRRLRSHGFLAASVVRDIKLLARDWSVLGDVLTGVVLWTLLPLVTVPVFDASPTFFANAMLVVLAVALGYEIAARLIPLERGGIAWSRLAPVEAWRWIAAKLATGTALSLPLLAIATASLGLAFNLPLPTLIMSLGVTVPALLLSLAAGLWTGAAFGRTDWKNPRAMLGLAGRLIAMLLLIGQAGLWLVFLVAAHDPAAPYTLPAWVGLLAAPILALPVLAAATRTLARREQ